MTDWSRAEGAAGLAVAGCYFIYASRTVDSPGRTGASSSFVTFVPV